MNSTSPLNKLFFSSSVVRFWSPTVTVTVLPVAVSADACRPPDMAPARSLDLLLSGFPGSSDGPFSFTLCPVSASVRKDGPPDLMWLSCTFQTTSAAGVEAPSSRLGWSLTLK